MEKNKRDSVNRLEKIRLQIDRLINKNREEVGIGQSITEIENDLLSGVLEVGKLLLEDRIILEEEELEKTGYSIVGKKNKESRTFRS